EAGRFQLDRQEVRLREFLDQLVDMFRLQAANKGIAFRFFPAETLPDVVYTDENRLRQVLINLISNAIKFTDSGHVTLQIKYRNQVAELTVEDSGIGIHPDDLDRVFRPFERARSGAARATTGTGLGLTITKMLVETMGGEITVASTPGVGSVFRVKLLLSEVPRPRTVPTPESQVHGYTGTPQTILIVDDDPVQRDLIRQLLEPLGFTVLIAASGAECLSLVDQHKVHLVLLDVSMPEMDGWEVADALHRGVDERPAIVMLSALTVDKSAEVKPDRAFDHYLIKPINLRQLMEKLRALLDIEWTHAAPDGLPEAGQQADPVAGGHA
ncbi:MAG: response regulator, partial [Xanthobacteraceae bacterium]|nr:response regulator [Xanthobacteraceae bacterium]